MTFKSIDELKNYILRKSGSAIAMAQEKVYQVIERFIKQYYAEYTPEVYERTYQLYRSLVKSDVKPTGNGWVAEVYFDLDALDYQIKHFTQWPVTSGGYMNPFNYAVSPDGSFSNPKGSAEKVLSSAAHGYHGGKFAGTAIWDEPMIVLWKSKRDLLKKALIDAGIPVK